MISLVELFHHSLFEVGQPCFSFSPFFGDVLVRLVSFFLELVDLFLEDIVFVEEDGVCIAQIAVEVAEVLQLVIKASSHRVDLLLEVHECLLGDEVVTG